MSKFSRSKIVGVATVSLAAVSLIGVGFSSWIIAARQVEDSANVTVTVGDVEDQRLNLTASLGTDNSVVFDCKGYSQTGVESPLFSVGTNGDVEDLTFAIKYKLSSADYFNGTRKAKLTLSLGAAFTTILSNNYAEIESVSNGTDWTKVDGSTYSTTISSSMDAESTLTVTLKWGSVFGNKNPALISGNGLTEEQITTYIVALRNLKLLTNGEDVSKKIKATLTAAPVAA